MNDETSDPWKLVAEDFLQKLLDTRKELEDIKAVARSSQILSTALEEEGFKLEKTELEEQQIPSSLDALSVSDEMQAIRRSATEELKALPSVSSTLAPSGSVENALQESDLQHETKIAVSKMVEQCKTNIAFSTILTELHHPPIPEQEVESWINAQAERVGDALTIIEEIQGSNLATKDKTELVGAVAHVNGIKWIPPGNLSQQQTEEASISDREMTEEAKQELAEDIKQAARTLEQKQSQTPKL